MHTNIQLLHELIFYLLYGLAALVTFIAIERFVFYLYTMRHAQRLHHAPGDASGSNVAAEVVRQVRDGQQAQVQRSHMEDLTEAIYIKARTHLVRHLWALDTIVTAAPLLGLIGTIFGIIETFSALAHSGISDPSAVSAGIGTALYATALGIGVALYGLLFYNLFQERVERIGDQIKLLILHHSQVPQA
jgi:biopolymer transport protein ExbB